MRLHLALSLAFAFAFAGCGEVDSVVTEHVRPAPEVTTRASVEPKTADLDAPDLALVVDVAGEPQVVVNEEPEETWGKGAPTLAATGDIYVARREVDLAAMPPTAMTQLGRSLKLFDDRGLRCEAVVSGLSLVVRVDPRQDTRDEWEGKGYSGKTTKATPSEIAAEVWSLGRPVIVGHVRAVTGTCSGATFARSALLAAPTTATATPADKADASRVFAFARTTPMFAAIQREFAAEPKIAGEPPRPARWEDMPFTRREIVTMRAGTTTYAWITVATDGGCGNFNARYGALLRQDASAAGGYAVVHAPEGGIEEAPRALLDFGDGAPAMLFDGATLRADAGSYRYQSQTVYSMECPC